MLTNFMYYTPPVNLQHSSCKQVFSIRADKVSRSGSKLFSNKDKSRFSRSLNVPFLIRPEFFY